MDMKTINKGIILISRKEARFLFHDFEAERISLKANNVISKTIPSIPKCDTPIIDVAEMIPAELLTTVLDTMVLESINYISHIVFETIIPFLSYFKARLLTILDTNFQ